VQELLNRAHPPSPIVAAYSYTLLQPCESYDLLSMLLSSFIPTTNIHLNQPSHHKKAPHRPTLPKPQILLPPPRLPKMAIYTHRCRTCGRKYSSAYSVGYKCADCINGSQALQRVSYQRDSGSSAAVIPRASGALAASFFNQPRSSDVKARQVTYKNGEYTFREEYR
jgi:hypothetical protein